jgi:SAM-dependent methyltransferase
LFTLKSKIRLIGNYIKSGNLLDIGCGSGEFLKEIQKKHFRVTGIEPNKGARNFTREHYKLNVIDEDEIDNLKASIFEIITMWHVLEHVYDLDGRIKQIQYLLSKDGILVVAVPNSNSWDAKHYGKDWAAFDLPRHLYHFESSSIKNLFDKYGFKLVKTKSMFFDAFYISLLSEKYKTGKTKFILGIFIGLISNLFALLNRKNYSSLTYVFKYK